MVGIFLYKIGGINVSEVWPFALGCILSIALPLLLGFVRNRSIFLGVQEFVASSTRLGKGTFNFHLFSFYLWCVLVLAVVGYTIYKAI